MMRLLLVMIMMAGWMFMMMVWVLNGNALPLSLLLMSALAISGAVPAKAADLHSKNIDPDLSRAASGFDAWHLVACLAP